MRSVSSLLSPNRGVSFGQYPTQTTASPEITQKKELNCQLSTTMIAPKFIIVGTACQPYEVDQS